VFNGLPLAPTRQRRTPPWVVGTRGRIRRYRAGRESGAAANDRAARNAPWLFAPPEKNPWRPVRVATGARAGMADARRECVSATPPRVS
jgi:hypothetical protein